MEAPLGEAGGVVDVVSAGGGGKRVRGLEVVLTKPDQSGAMYARKMRVQALTKSEMYGTDVWRTMSGGRADCRACSRLEMRPVPVGARRVKVDVILGGMDLEEGGFVYLFDVL